jgi:metal-responsive CopG/Arc/MetJ family transcriptional regulator
MEEKLKITSKPRGNDGHRITSIRIEEEMISEIEKISKKTGRSRNELINMLLKHALLDYEIVTDGE